MLHVALFQPQIAPNTGNIIRLMANTGGHLHIIEPMGFDFEERKLQRAGLDYHDLAKVTRYPDYAHFTQAMQGRRILALTTKGTGFYHQHRFAEQDVLLFGSETAGLAPAIHQQLTDEHKLRLPMQASSRSLNLSNTVAIVYYEAWRQLGFVGGL